MKKKLLSKVLALTLTAAMILGTAACGSAANGTPKEPEAAVEESKPAEEVAEENESVETAEESNEEPAVEVTEPEELTYPLTDAAKLTFFGLVPSVHKSFKDYTESPFHSGLAEHTGVDVEWQFPAPGTDWNQAVNLMLAGDELPNVIFIEGSKYDCDQLIADGVIVDLTEWIPVYAPDYWEYINSDPNILRSVKSTAGKLYGFHTILESDYNATYLGPVVRQDWLDECGLDIPVTLEEWEEVLVAFKDKYGARFGFAPGCFDGPSIGTGVDAYGTFTAQWYVDNEGKIQLAQAQPEWKEYMEILNRWYEMDLIDKDSFSMDNAAVRAKVLNNEIGVSFTAMSQISAWTQDAEAENTGAQWVGFSYPRTTEGAATCRVPMNRKVVGWSAMITTSCSEEEIISALRWLNYGYCEEGMMYWNFGTEGESYILDENGEVQWTDVILEDPDGKTAGIDKYSGATGMGISVQKERLVQLKNVDAAANAVWTWIDNTESNDHLVIGNAYTTEEQTEYSDKFAAIETYVKEKALQFVVGDESLDQFDAFVEELYELGLQECVDIQQSSFERFMSR